MFNLILFLLVIKDMHIYYTVHTNVKYTTVFNFSTVVDTCIYQVIINNALRKVRDTVYSYEPLNILFNDLTQGWRTDLGQK